ncbi:MAG: lysophospholipid acyltransferase family protein [Desulfatibacillum sp.]|nr:lysophospholipid acyltransferase family protein [Desulfatibacillum sp.]
MSEELTSKRSKRLKWRLVGILGKFVIDALFFTCRIRIKGYEAARPVMERKPFILAFWHSRILMVSYLFKGWNAAIMVSASEDGEYIAQVLQRQGHDCVRGSSTRHGIRAMASMVKKMQNGQPAGIVPDGPQGPRQKLQPGVISVARKMGVPIVPITYSAKRRKVFSSWDRFILPKPFTETLVIYGKPVMVPSEMAPHEFEAKRQEVEDELNRITARAENEYGHEVDY